MTDWLNDPRLKDMDAVKLELFKTAASQTSGKSGKALAPVIMALVTSAGKKGVKFTPDEISLVLNILKEGKPASELAQLDKMVQMITTMMKKN